MDDLTVAYHQAQGLHSIIRRKSERQRERKRDRERERLRQPHFNALNVLFPKKITHEPIIIIMTKSNLWK